MGFFESEDFTHFGLAALAAAAIGYAVPWTLDRLILRRLMADRVASIALGGAFVFLLLMGGTAFYLTRTSPFPDHPIIIPPVGFAVSFLLGTAAAGAARLAIYSHFDSNLDEPIVFDTDPGDLSQYDDELNAWDEKHGHKNYFRRHWTGHLSLPVSYWINGGLLSALIAGAAEYLDDRIKNGGASLRWLAIFSLTYFAVAGAVWIWSSVGIWRSAYWHRRRGGSWGWGFAARALIVVSVVGTLVRSQDIARAATEFGTLAAGRDSLGAVADMAVSKDGRSLTIRGTLALDAAARFRKLLAASPRVTDVVLESPGGRMLEAERIADSIRERRLATRVEHDCMSACTSILLAGRERTAPEDARIGFHQPAFPGLDAAELQGAFEETRASYVAAGVDPGFAWRAMSTPAQSMWFPSADELLAAHVLTGTDFVISAETPAQKAANRVLRRRALQLRLHDMANAINATGPTRLDALTTFERARVDDTTLTNLYSVHIPGSGAVVPGADLKKKLQRQACDSPAMSAAIRDGASFVHAYSRAGGKHLFDVAVSRCPD